MPAKPLAPADSPRARWLAALLGVALLALCGVAVREFVVWYWRPTGWRPWVNDLPGLVTGMSPEWTAISGVIAVALGLFLVVSALRPRKRRYVRIDAPSADIWLRPVDIARYSTSSVKRLPGVVSASTFARKNRVTVDVAGRDLTHDDVTRHLETTLHKVFSPDLEVHVSLREPTEEDEL